MNIVELLPFINIFLSLGLIPLVKALFAINKSLDEISTGLRLLEQDVNSKVRDLGKELDRMDSRLRKVEDHTIMCVQTLKNINKD